MAVDITRKIEISFNAVNKTGTALTSVSRDLDKLVYSVSNVVSPLSSAAKGIAAIDAALIALAAGGIAYSTKQFASFDDTMRKVGSIMGATDEEIVNLTELTKELGATTRYTAKESAEGLEFLAMAGLSASESMEALPQTLKLAQASATGLGNTADILTNIMAGYDIAVGDLANTTDILTAGFTSSNTNLMELGGAFKYVGPVAASMGYELESTTAILGKLADAGYKGEQGGTALRNIMIALAAPAGNVGKLMKELGVNTEEMGIDLADSANALKSLGVNVKDAEGNLAPFPDIMQQLQAGLDKIPDPADRAATLIEVFGKRGGPQMAALLNQGADSVAGLESKIRSLGGITDKVATDMEAGIGGALRGLRSAFESTALAVGENASKGLIDPIYSVTDFFRTLTFTVNQGMFDPVFNAFDKFGDEIADAVDDIAENLPEALEEVDFSRFLDALGDFGQAFGSVFEGVDLDTPEGLADAIQRVVDTLESLTRLSVELAQTFINVGKYVGGLIEKFNSLDQDTIATFGKIVAIGAAVSAIAAPVALATTALKGLAGVITVITANPLVLALAGVSAAVYGVVKGVDYLTQKIGGFDDVAESIKPPEGLKEFSGTVEDIATATDGAGGALDTMAEKSKTDFNKMVKDVENASSWTGYLTEEMKKLGILKVEPTVEVKGADKAQKQFETLTYWIGDPKAGGVKKEITVEVDTSKVEESAKKIEEAIPPVKKLEFETDLKIEEIKAQAQVAEAAFKMRAEIDIAEIEAGARIMEAMAEGVASSFASTGDVITGLFSNLDDESSLSKQNAIMRAIAEEQERRTEALNMQKELNQAQIEYMEARTKALDRGEATLTVQADNLAPYLEAIWEEILAQIQVKASQETLDQVLLGA